MLRGLYSVSTVLEQNTRAINVMSNNLANVNTHGYKKDLAMYEEFSAKLISKMGGNDPTTVGGIATVTITERDDTKLATTSNGYFRVEGDGGVSYNTSVELRAGDDGILRTVYRNGYQNVIKDAGQKVLGANGPIQVGDQGFEVDEAGNVLVGGQIVDSLVYQAPKGVIGTMSGGIKFNRVVTDLSQSDLQRTETALDFGLNDKGFFTVMTPQGERYTRNGQFKINSNMELVTDENYNVIGMDGPIVLDDRNISVNKFGEIAAGGVLVDKFKIVNPSNVERLKKIGASIYRFDGEMEEEAYGGDVLQGFLEGSNVDSLKEMIQIMEMYRSYESAQRVVRSYDDTLGKAVNDVARV
jgi:flagellar basal-body rod protein FlgG